MKLQGKRVDLPLLTQEATTAGVVVGDLGTVSLDQNGLPDELITWDADGQTVDVPPTMQPVVDAHDASKTERSVAFETAEDAERLRMINERARVDPAYAALAALVLKGVPR